MNVLATCAGRRHYLMGYLREVMEPEDHLIGADISRTAPALALCDSIRMVPKVDSSDYLPSLSSVCLEEQIDIVFSLNDLELELLAEHRDWLERQTGAVFVIPSPEAAAICADKWRTYSFAIENNIPVPASFLTVEDALAAIKAQTASYPLIVKPRWGSASIGLFTVDDSATLEAAFIECHKAIKGSALSGVGDSSSAVLIQEKITGPEYGVDILNDLGGEFVGFTAKKKLAMRAGETDKAVTVAPEPFNGHIEKIAQALKHRGNLDCDFLERNGKLYLLEMNARFGGGYPFTHLAGSNHVQRLLDNFRHRQQPPYRYEQGLAFAKYDSLVQVPSP